MNQLTQAQALADVGYHLDGEHRRLLAAAIERGEIYREIIQASGITRQHSAEVAALFDELEAMKNGKVYPNGAYVSRG